MCKYVQRIEAKISNLPGAQAQPHVIRSRRLQKTLPTNTKRIDTFRTYSSSPGIAAAAVDESQPKRGVQKGPKKIKEHGFEELFKMGWLTDLGMSTHHSCKLGH